MNSRDKHSCEVLQLILTVNNQFELLTAIDLSFSVSGDLSFFVPYNFHSEFHLINFLSTSFNVIFSVTCISCSRQLYLNSLNFHFVFP